MQNIFIIIVNYQSEDVIGDAISSFDEDNIKINIVILDNGSTEKSYKNLRKAVGDDVEIIRNSENLGFSAGANFTAKYIQSKYTDISFFLFFNPDATASKNMIEVLHKTLLSYTTAAAVSPLILDMKDEKWFSGTTIDWKKCKINNNPIVEKSKEVREIDAFNGCAVLMDAKRFFDAGMFNEDLFIYYDEPFLSQEFLSRGYVSLYQPNTIAHHHVSFNTGLHSTFKSRLMTRNHIYFFKKYGKEKKFLCPYLVPLRMTIFYLKRFKFSNIKHLFLGMFDAQKGKKGIS